MSSPILLGLVGHPISHSLSPKLHTAGLKYCNLVGEYKLYDLAPGELTSWISSLISQGLTGFNVTIPYKTTILKTVDKLMPEAELTGAVNTVVVSMVPTTSARQLIGHNTDVVGFMSAVETGFKRNFKNAKALIFGYGGSAKAVLVGLLKLGITSVQVAGRDRNKVLEFIRDANGRLSLGFEFSEDLPTIALKAYAPENNSTFDLVVNTIPFGLSGNEVIPDSVLSTLDKLPSTCYGFDLVYCPDRQLPLFARVFKDRGLRVQDGIEMLIQQAKLSFQIWTGKEVPVEIFKAAI